MDGEAGASSLVPGGSFSDVVAEVSVGRRTSSSKSRGEEVLGFKGSLVEAVLRVEGDAGVAPEGRLGVEPGPGGGAELGLGTDVLECNNGAVGRWFGGEGVAKSLTVRGPERDTQESSLSEMTVWC